MKTLFLVYLFISAFLPLFAIIFLDMSIHYEIIWATMAIFNVISFYASIEKS